MATRKQRRKRTSAIEDVKVATPTKKKTTKKTTKSKKKDTEE